MSVFMLAEKQSWAITEEALRLIFEIAARENPESPEALSKRLGRPLDNARVTTVRDNVAILPIEGPIFPKANLFSSISGATSLQQLAHDFETAANNPSVDAILLEVNSPGGTVEGVNEFALMITEVRKRKPVWAFVSHSASSAAYWIASACEKVIIEETAHAGSIGVVLTMRKPDDPASARNVEFVSSVSPHKRPDISTEPGRARVQSYVDVLGGIFVDAVSRQRKMKAEDVVAIGGDVLVGKNAVKAGLADAVGSLESTIAELKTHARGAGYRASQANASTGENMKFRDTAIGKQIAALFESDVEAKAVDTPAPAPAATSSVESEALKQALDQLATERAERFKSEAKAYAGGLFAGNIILPFQRAQVEEDLLQALMDDAAHPVASGQKSRAERVRLRYEQAKPHSLTTERVVDPKDNTLRVLSNDPQAEDHDKLEAQTRAWAVAKNGNGRKVA